MTVPRTFADLDVPSTVVADGAERVHNLRDRASHGDTSRTRVRAHTNLHIHEHMEANTQELLSGNSHLVVDLKTASVAC